MTRLKKRRIAQAVKVSLLLALPIAVGASAKGVPAVKSALSGFAEADLGKEDQLVRQPDYAQDSGSDPEEDILSGALIVSQGYGVLPETRQSGTGVKLLSPLEMVSADPGPKPYPAQDQWSLDGKILRTTYGEYSGDSFFDLEGGGQVNNKTSISNDSLRSESRCLPNFTISETDEPQVLIYHTHTTESFEPFVRESYDTSFNYRTTDETKNIVMVGDAIQAELEASGIGVIHARTIHDYPSYNGSYGRSRETILPILEQYPTIKVALDIHRDAISAEGVAYQPFSVQQGKEAAQVMIISGCDDGTLDMPEYMKNFHFACSFQQQLESDWPGLTRPILFDYRHYNQDLTTGSLLIEVGSHGNTLEQVQYSGQLIGQSLGKLLESIKEEP